MVGRSFVHVRAISYHLSESGVRMTTKPFADPPVPSIRLFTRALIQTFRACVRPRPRDRPVCIPKCDRPAECRLPNARSQSLAQCTGLLNVELIDLRRTCLFAKACSCTVHAALNHLSSCLSIVCCFWSCAWRYQTRVLPWWIARA